MQTLIQSTNAYDLLQAEKNNTRLHHAYLLVTDDPKNLRAFLKIFAKILFGCEYEETVEQKRISSLIDKDLFTDLLCFPRKDKKFTVAESADLLDEIPLKGVEGDKKVFIVSDFAEATEQAQNKLLKILEEPPENIYFLLGASVSYPVLSTVLSRTEKLEIPPFSQENIKACLSRIYENTQYTDRQLTLCAAASGGSLGGAQSVLLGGYYESLTETAFSLALSTPSTLPVLVKKLPDLNKRELLSLLQTVFRDALVLKLAKTNSIYYQDVSPFKNPCVLLLSTEKENTQKVADKYTLNALLKASDALIKAEKQIKFNANFAQCLEICISEIFIANK